MAAITCRLQSWVVLWLFDRSHLMAAVVCLPPHSQCECGQTFVCRALLVNAFSLGLNGDETLGQFVVLVFAHKAESVLALLLILSTIGFETRLSLEGLLQKLIFGAKNNGDGNFRAHLLLDGNSCLGVLSRLRFLYLGLLLPAFIFSLRWETLSASGRNFCSYLWPSLPISKLKSVWV